MEVKTLIKTINANLYKALNTDRNIKYKATVASTFYLAPVVGSDNITLTKTEGSANAISVLPRRYEDLYDATRQVETATVIGAITKAGNATVVVTSAELAGSPITLSVAVLLADTIAQTAIKIQQAMRANKIIADHTEGKYIITGTAANIVMTQIEPIGNDSTLNISIDNDTCTGLTTAATSTATTAGVAVTISANGDYKTFTSSDGCWSIVDSKVINSAALSLYNLGAPDLADDNLIVTTTNMKVGTYTVAAQPDIPRNITVTHAAGDTVDTLGTINIVGTDIDDAVLTETITPVNGTEAAGVKAFKSIVSVTGVGWVIDAAEGTNDTIIVGCGTELGLDKALNATTKVAMGVLGVTITVTNATVNSTTPTKAETTIDMSTQTYNGTKEALVFVVD